MQVLHQIQQTPECGWLVVLPGPLLAHVQAAGDGGDVLSWHIALAIAMCRNLEHTAVCQCVVNQQISQCLC